MKEYKILEGVSASELERKINEMLLAGWELHGCISTSSFNDHSVILFQPVIRERKNESSKDGFGVFLSD